MIRFYYNSAPNPMKVALFLEEAGLPYEVVPIDTRKGEQHEPGFRAINPNAKVPAIVDTEGVGGAAVTVFDSNAILLYLGDKIGRFVGAPADRGPLLSWLMFIATGLGPYSGQSVHFQRAAPEVLPYAVNRYRREAERHYEVLDGRLADRTHIVGDAYSIVDMAAWGWVERIGFVLPGDVPPLDAFPNVKRWYEALNTRPAVARAHAIASRFTFKQEMDEAALRAMFPSNYPKAGV
jgi:GST-like protein